MSQNTFSIERETIAAHLLSSRFVAGSVQNSAHVSTQQPPVSYYIIVVSAFLQAFEVSSGNKLYGELTKGNFIQGGKRSTQNICDFVRDTNASPQFSDLVLRFVCLCKTRHWAHVVLQSSKTTENNLFVSL